MSYQRIESRLGIHVTPQVAEALVSFLPTESQILAATQQMQMTNPQLRLALVNTVNDLKAAARLSRTARKENAVVGNLAAEETAQSGESEVKGIGPAGGSLLRSESAAELLGISSRRVRQLCISKELEAEKPGTEWLISRESVDRYLTLKQIGTAA